MPLIHARDAPITRIFIDNASATSTTTVIRAAPTGATQRPHPVPVPAIAAGVVGGAILAILVTVGWVCWGKSIKRSSIKQMREAVRSFFSLLPSPPPPLITHPPQESLRRTRQNTQQNALVSKQRTDSYQQLYAPPSASEKKIKFAHDEPWHIDAPSKSVFPGRHFTTHFMPAHLRPPPKPTPTPTPSAPKPLRSVKGSAQLAALASEQKQEQIPTPPPTPPTLLVQPPPRPKKSKQRMSHKPSDISSVSMYSTASGEERQPRIAGNLLLAALGNLGGGGDRTSGVSSRWSLISRWTQGIQPNQTQTGGGEVDGSNRQSRASNKSQASSQGASVDSSGMPVGVAY